jgi:transposase
VAADPRDIRIAELEAQVAARDKVIAELMAKVEALTARVAELEAKLGQNSSNSSKPPSSDPPGMKRAPTRQSSGRRPGGQPGHKHHKREMVPPDQVTRFENLPAPRHCRRCMRPLRGKVLPPVRWQQTEVPPIKPEIIEFCCPGQECDDCGIPTYADMPDGAEHAFGERLTAIIGLLSGKYRQSKRLVQSALSDLLGVQIALGSVSNRDMEVSAALAAPMAEAERAVQDADRAHGDETGWAEGTVDGHKKRAWLWVVVTAQITLFRVSISRGSEVAKAMLGDAFSGIFVSDRWSAYNWIDLALRQLCWSHLTRDWQAFIDRGGESARIGGLLMKHLRQQNRNVLEYLTEAVRAHRHGQSGPSLLPEELRAQIGAAA